MYGSMLGWFTLAGNPHRRVAGSSFIGKRATNAEKQKDTQRLEDFRKEGEPHGGHFSDVFRKDGDWQAIMSKSNKRKRLSKRKREEK